MGKLELEEGTNRRREVVWGWNKWILAALIGIIAASIAASALHIGPMFSLFTFSNKVCTCQSQNKLSGMVEDCCCDYETVDTLNKDVLHPLLQEITKTPFFRYFKVRLWCDCPFWPDDGMCHLRDCSVCECPDHEFPETFKRPSGHLSSDDLMCQEGKPQATVDRTVDSKAFVGWTEIDNPWTYDDETDNAEMTYVNLQLNPERYTGYTGPSARRIWDSIYKEHCLEGMCCSSIQNPAMHRLHSNKKAKANIYQQRTTFRHKPMI